MRIQNFGVGFALSMGLTAVIGLSGCTPFYANQSTSSISSPESTPDGLFGAAQAVLKANCVACHSTGGTGTPMDFSNPHEFINSGLIVPGSPRSSKLIFRLKNFNGSASLNQAASTSANMPPAGQLTEAQFNAIYTWILEMPADASPFQCVSETLTPAKIPAANAKRLSLRQYRNTLIDLLSHGVSNSVATTLVDAAMATANLPSDTGTTFSRENNAFNDDHASGFFEVATDLSDAISVNHTGALVTAFIQLNPGACTNIDLNNLSTTCRNQLIRNFAGRAFRRPLREGTVTNIDSQTINELTALATDLNTGSLQVGFNNLVFRTILSPHFIYQLEDQDLAVPHALGQGLHRLNSYAIASRLSYRFWNTMPDSTLWNLARTTDLSTDTGYLAALNHVIERKDKLDNALREYYYDWLRLDRTPRFSPNPRFNVLANNIQFNDSLRAAMIAEIEELGSFTTTSGGSFADLFLTNISFARSNHLMSIYGVQTPAPASFNSTTAVRLPAGERAGLLTRAALLISGSEIASPILRGAHLRKDILCLNLGAPPATALEEFDNIQVPVNSSLRQSVHIKTSGAACVSCHNLLNPLGFGLSNFDAFGRHILQEPIFNADGTAIRTTVTVDAKVDLSPIFGPGVKADNPTQLSRSIASQQTAKVCFAEKFMTYSFARPTDRNRDACRLEKIYNNLGDDAQLIDVIRTTALDPEFRLRKIVP